MRTIVHFLRALKLGLLLAALIISPGAQEVFIPDAGLNAAIRDSLHKPGGPLTQQDLLSLTNLDASRREIRSIEGLEAAHNLAFIDLNQNHLASFTVPGALTELRAIDLSVNGLTNCVI